MKARPYKEIQGGYEECSVEEVTHVMIELPGPIGHHMLPVITHGSRDKHSRSPVWTWNGDTEKVTLKPSIRSQGGRDGKVVTHVWVNDGMVQFLGDCTHELANQTLPLLEVE
jgi:hypothetical protein